MNAERKENAQRNSVQACKRSYILPSCIRPCYFQVVRFHDNKCKKAFRAEAIPKDTNEKRPHNANLKVRKQNPN